MKYNVGERIRDLRVQSGLNQAQVANYLGVDQSNVSKCEKGERQFTMEALEKLCNLFGVKFVDFMDGIKEDVPALKFAFRAGTIQDDDLQVIANINRIAMNIREMEELLEI